MVEVKAEHPGDVIEEEKKTKLLGAHVDTALYWRFKNAASAREEQLKDAVVHAALMYIELPSTTEGGS